MNNNIMRKLIASRGSLLLKTRFNYVPVSNYEVQRKQNPVIEVSLGNDKGKLFDLHFRVTSSPLSSSRTPSLAPLKTSGAFCSALRTTRAAICHSSETISTSWCLEHLRSSATSRAETAPSSARISGTSPSSCPTTGPDCSAA